MAELPENDRMAGPFIAADGQTDFPGDFPLIDAPGDAPGTCVVFVRERAGVVTELALGSFTVPASTDGGFTLRLVVPALAGDRCFIVGRQRQARLRAHPAGGAVRTPTLEDDAREATARHQEARRDLERALVVPFGEAPLLLPPRAQLTGGLLTATETGLERVTGTPGHMVIFDPLTGQPTSAPVRMSVSSAPVVVSSKLAAEVMDWSGDPPTQILVQGWLSPGDGGRALWKWVAEEPAHAGKFQLLSGQWYELAEAKVYPDQLGAQGASASDTAAFVQALQVAAALGVPVGVLPRTYHIDANCTVNADELSVIGDDPMRSVLQMERSRGGWMLAWATTGPTRGGGVQNLTLRGHADILSGGNGALRFGTDSGATHHHADGWLAKDVVIQTFAQYGLGVNSGSEWEARRVQVLEHGYTAYDPGSCMGVYIYPRDEDNKSHGGYLEDIVSKISDASRDFGVNSAAMKLQTHVDLRAKNIWLEGGGEEVVSIDCLERGSIDGLDVILTAVNPSYAAKPGIAYRSRSTAHGFVSTRCDMTGVRVRKRDSSVVSINGWLWGAGSASMTEANCDGLHLTDLTMPGLNMAFLNYTVVRNCNLKGIECEDFRFGTSLSGTLAHGSLRTGANVIDGVKAASGPSGYDGDSSRLKSVGQSAPGNLGWRAVGVGNDYDDVVLSGAHSSVAQLSVQGTDQTITRLRILGCSGRSIHFTSTASGNQLVDPAGEASGTGVLHEGTNNTLRRSPDSLQVVTANADTTLTSAPATVLLTADLTGTDRALNLTRTGVAPGARTCVSRRGGGTGNWTIMDDGNLLATLAAAGRADLVFDGAAWVAT